MVEPLGLVGGFLDAAGGGGWGPVVTSQPARPGRASEEGDRHGQHRRILPRGDDLGDLPRLARRRGLHHGDGRAC